MFAFKVLTYLWMNMIKKKRKKKKLYIIFFLHNQVYQHEIILKWNIIVLIESKLQFVRWNNVLWRGLCRMMRWNEMRRNELKWLLFAYRINRNFSVSLMIAIHFRWKWSEQANVSKIRIDQHIQYTMRPNPHTHTHTIVEPDTRQRLATKKMPTSFAIFCRMPVDAWKF